MCIFSIFQTLKILKFAKGNLRRTDKRGFMTKYIFVTGGVVSGLGKGIVAASLGRLLKL